MSARSSSPPDARGRVVLWELRTPRPMVGVRLFTLPDFTTETLALTGPPRSAVSTDASVEVVETSGEQIAAAVGVG